MASALANAIVETSDQPAQAAALAGEQWGPLLEAAYRHTAVVCAVHVGIVRGVLQENGADPTGTQLFPFSEPHACGLIVPPLS